MQGDLDFGRDHRVSEAHRHLLRALNDAVDAVGLAIAAGACGTRTQDLSDALSGRANRYVRIEWVLAILDVSTHDYRMTLGLALIGWIGLAPAPAKKLKPEEKLAIAKQRVIAKFGPAGAELVAEMEQQLG